MYLCYNLHFLFSARLLNIQPTKAPAESVAFYAYFSSSSIPATSPHYILAFDKVITNVGNAYHPHMGTFIAPRSGFMYSPGQLDYGDTDITTPNFSLITMSCI